MNLVIGLFGYLVIGALMLQAAAAPKFDSNRAWQDLRQLVAIFGPFLNAQTLSREVFWDWIE